MTMQTRYFNCKKCKHKKSVLFQEHKPRYNHATCCHGFTKTDIFMLRTFQWQCGYCGYNKVQLNINNGAEIITYE